MNDIKEPEPTPVDTGPFGLNREILNLVKHKSDVHYALETLFRLCAPECIPEENTLYLINQIDNVIAGYRSVLKVIISHWNEFGPEAGFDELMDAAARRIKFP